MSYTNTLNLVFLPEKDIKVIEVGHFWGAPGIVVECELQKT